MSSEGGVLELLHSQIVATGKQQIGGKQLASHECDLLAEYNATPLIMVLYIFFSLK